MTINMSTTMGPTIGREMHVVLALIGVIGNIKE